MTTTSAPLTPLTTREDYLEAVDRVRAAAEAYYGSGQVVMDDPSYDALMRGLAAAEADHPDWTVADSPTDRVGSARIDATKAVRHASPMLSLDNLFSIEPGPDGAPVPDRLAQIVDWVAGRERLLGRPVSAFTVEKKYDGSACSALYQDGRLVRIATRGDGAVGENRSYALDRVANLPRTLTTPFTGEVRGEVMFRRADYEAADAARTAAGKSPYANARNAAHGAFAAETLTYPVRLTFFPYSATGLTGQRTHSGSLAALRELGFTIAADAVTVCHSVEQVKAAVAALEEARPTLDHEIDGAVIKVDLLTEQDELGLASRAPRWGVAFKYPPDEAISTLEEVLWNVGRTGVLAPRARITPTFVGGTTVSSATLHNPGDIARKGFLLGDPVMLKRAGEVIPRLEAPVVALRDGTQTPIELPERCPRCDSALDKSQERWRCVRGRDCNRFATIRYGLTRDAFYVKGVAGQRIVTELVDRGLVADIGDVFTLTEADFLTLPRVAALSAGNYVQRIAAAKDQPLSRVVTALGLRGTGRSLSARIARHFGTMTALRAATEADFLQIQGIGKEKAPEIVTELADLAEVIDKLIAAGVNMVEPAAEIPDGVAPDQLPLAGMTVVATGSMSGPLAALGRTEVKELIERAGGRSSDSVSKRTSLLVAGDGAGSKLAKAHEHGVPVETPEQFAVRVAAFLPAT